MSKIARIQLPDGRIAKFEVGDDATEADVMAAAQNLSTPAPAEPPQDAPPLQKAGVPMPPQSMGLGERLRLMASDQAITPLAREFSKAAGAGSGYLADLATKGANSLGLTQVQADQMPSQRYDRFMDQLFGNAPNNPASTIIGRGVGLLADPTNWLMPGAKAPLYRQPPGPAAMQPPDVARETGIMAGYKRAPSEVSGAPLGKLTEAIGGKNALADDLSHINQNVSDDITRSVVDARRAGPDGGINEALTNKMFSDARDKIDAATYEPVRAAAVPVPMQGVRKQLRQLVSAAPGPYQDTLDKAFAKFAARTWNTPKSGDVLPEISNLRGLADDAFNKRDGGLGKVYKQASDALQQALDSSLQVISPDLFRNYVAGRKQMAQNYAAERATLEGVGKVDTSVLAGDLEKGEPLSEGLMTMAQQAANFPRTNALPIKGEAAPMQKPSQIGWGHIGMALNLAGMPFRKFLTSEAYQDSLNYPGMLAGERRFAGGVPTSIYSQKDPDNKSLYDLWSAPE